MIEREKYMQARVVNYHGVNSIEINGKIFSICRLSFLDAQGKIPQGL